MMTEDIALTGIDDSIDSLLRRAIVDPDFRETLGRAPDRFVDELLHELPTAVAPMDLTFVELVKEADSASDLAACRSTCVSGFTFRCDGSTFPDGGCRATCVSGFTILCDGTTN